MDTKTIIVTLVCAVLGSSALTAVADAIRAKGGTAFAFCF